MIELDPPSTALVPMGCVLRHRVGFAAAPARYPHHRAWWRLQPYWRGIDCAPGYEHGYELLIVKDAATSSVAEGHDMSMKHTLPRLGRLVQGGDLTFTRI